MDDNSEILNENIINKKKSSKEPILEEESGKEYIQKHKIYF